MSAWTVRPSEQTVDQMVVKFLSARTVLPSEQTVDQMVVKLLSARTVLPSEQTVDRHVARVLERGLHFAGSGELPKKFFKFKVANTPKFNDFLQLPKKFWISKYLLLMTEMPDIL